MARMRHNSRVRINQLGAREPELSKMLGRSHKGMAVDFLTNTVVVRWPGTQYNKLRKPHEIINQTAIITNKQVFLVNGYLGYAPNNNVRSLDYNSLQKFGSMNSSLGYDATEKYRGRGVWNLNAVGSSDSKVASNWYPYTKAGATFQRYVAKMGDQTCWLKSWFNYSGPAVFGCHWGIADGTLGVKEANTEVHYINDLGGGWYDCTAISKRMSGTNHAMTVHNTEIADTSSSSSADLNDTIFIAEYQFGAYPNHIMPDSSFVPKGIDPFDFVRRETVGIGTNTGKYQSCPWTYDPLTTGNPIRGMLSDQTTRTTLELYGNDMTNAAWAAGDTFITATKDQDGPDGVANQCTRLTATANDGWIGQAITSTSADRIFQPFIKRVTGTGTIEITVDGGTGWTDITSGVDGADAVFNGYYWAKLRQTAVTNPTIGFRLGTSGDEISVGWANIFTIANSFDEYYTPAFSYGTQLTVTEDDWKFTAGEFPKIEDGWTAMCEFYVPSTQTDDAAADTHIWAWDNDASNKMSQKYANDGTLVFNLGTEFYNGAWEGPASTAAADRVYPGEVHRSVVRVGQNVVEDALWQGVASDSANWDEVEDATLTNLPDVAGDIFIGNSEQEAGGRKIIVNRFCMIPDMLGKGTLKDWAQALL